MPTVLAASTMSLPAGIVILCPSIVRLTSGTCRHRPRRAFMSQGVVLVLLPEVAEGGVDHPAGGVAETAQAAAVLQAVRDALQRVEVDLRPLVGQHPLVGSHRPIAPHPTRRAFAAQL